MDDFSAFRIDCLKAVIQSANENYKENARIAALLDDKAQKTGGMAGIFLAVMFGFLSPDKVHTLAMNLSIEFLLGALGAASLFIFCVGLCLWVMWLRSVPMPVSADNMHQMAQDILQLPRYPFTSEIREAYLNEQIVLWKRILKSQTDNSRKKARILLVAQALVGSGMLLVAGLLAVIVRNEIMKVPSI